MKAFQGKGREVPLVTLVLDGGREVCVYDSWSLSKLRKIQMKNIHVQKLCIASSFKEKEKVDIPVQIKGIRELDVSEIDQLNDAIKKLFEQEREFSLMEAVATNYIEIETTLRSILDEFISAGGTSLERQLGAMTDINRRVLNFLSLTRCCLDHTETSLKRRHGEESEEFKKFKSASSLEFDSKFSYRFLYKLRNYSQHCGMPVGSLSLQSSSNSDGTISQTLEVSFSKASLLKASFSWGRRLKEELEMMPDSFNIIPLLLEFNNSIVSILEKVRRAEDERVEPFADCIISFAEEALKDAPDNCNNYPCIADVFSASTNEASFNLIWLPVNISRRLKYRLSKMK